MDGFQTAPPLATASGLATPPHSCSAANMTVFDKCEEVGVILPRARVEGAGGKPAKGKRGRQRVARLEKVQTNACFLGLEKGVGETELGTIHHELESRIKFVGTANRVGPDGSKGRITAIVMQA